MGVLSPSDARRGCVHRGPPEAVMIRIATTAEAFLTCEKVVELRLGEA